MIRRLVSGPPEGWLSVGLVMLMCVTMAWAIDDIAPVLGRDDFTNFLTWAAIGGVLAGFIGPQVGWGRWRTYLIGSLFAALLIPLVVGGILPHADTLKGQFEATAAATVNAYYQLVVQRLSFTQEYGHHLLVIGLIVWATSMFAAYATFGHRRPLNAVVTIGVILVINMSVAAHDQLGYLILYSVAALFLLIRCHALDERAEWLRRRIGDPSAISSIYLRGGTLFIVMAVAGSFLLTKAATSAPLAHAWDGVSANVFDMTQSLAKFLPAGPNTRSFGADFGEESQIRGFWVGSDAVAATIQMPVTAPRDMYWRAVTYDRFDLTAWKSTQAVDHLAMAGETILDGSMDALPPTLATDTVTFTVTPTVFYGKYLLSPLNPVTSDQTATLSLAGAGGFFTGLRRSSTAQPYTITAAVPIRNGSKDGGLEANRLREAGTDYPKEVLDLYLQPNPEGAMGPAANALLDEMLATIPGGADATPYDIAHHLEAQFHDNDRFIYDVDVSDLPCADRHLSSVECFSEFKKGFCQYYASTMAIFLRELGIPSRIAEGFLPGARNARTGEETLLVKDRHYWVEVYFPGFGWVPFDPTGGGVAALGDMDSGAPVASQTPRPSRTGAPGASGLTRLDPRDGTDRPNGGGFIGNAPSAGLLGAVAILLTVVFGALGFIVWRRGPRGGTSPDRAYGMVTRLASRLGFGPRPNQTVYEYASALGDILPDARPALETVARAKVETTYGRASLGVDRLESLRDAERRLRVALLRLLFRRDQRPR